MPVTRTEFGQVDGEDVYKYTIENSNKTRISILTYAATWQNFEVYEDGEYHSLISHFDDLQSYIKTPFQVGKTVGRVAGRIGKAKFMINGKTYQLTPNNQSNLMHGGDNGIQTKNFNSSIDEAHNSVSLSLIIKSKDDDFPGNIDLMITYFLSDHDEVSINYTAVSDADTLFNPTCHIYFDLGEFSIMKDNLQIASDDYLDVDDEKVPTGSLIPVDKAFDFRKGQIIENALCNLEKQNGKLEFDDTFVTHGDRVATLSSGRRSIDLYSDRNGLVIFTANPTGKKTPHQYSGLAMELQTLPDAVNHSDFGNIILRKNQKASYTNKYQYRKL
ncbi:aldose epimerase family protein [Companilactobacillus jidongensis]|uniref:aldose epimerase family protein n=1 Tax=Companilactobacillus jidongensis TaxID=2486006 RepID=UPI000F78C8A1|nr:aldose epimerase family protein [Companilactobacillus jidongensis]